MTTCCALATCVSIMKIFTPPLQQALLVFRNEPRYAVDLLSAEAAASLKPRGIEPEFGYLIVTLDMYVGRLLTITRIEEETVRASP
jgi:hypothetical protein